MPTLQPSNMKDARMALHHAAAGEVVKLVSASDAEARTTAVVKTDSFEAIHLVVRADEHIPEHKVPGSVSLFCIEGVVIVGIGGGDRQMNAGEWLYLDRDEPHSVSGIEDASLILTILFEVPNLRDPVG